MDGLRILSYGRGKVAEHGLNVGGRMLFREIMKGVGYHLGRPFGTPIFERDWDVLVILDACRVDALREVQDEYDFLEAIQTLTSRGSSSYSWLERNFSPEFSAELDRTAYVSGNPFTDDFLDEDSIGHLESLNDVAYDTELATVPARPITDRAISVMRESTPDRLIVHYMQPHFPSVPDPVTLCEKDHHTIAIDCHRAGCVSTERVWDAYIENLRYVLDETEVLLSSIDADRVVISADHGEAFGEFRVFGHPSIPIPQLRKVPWAVTSASDTGDYEPTYEPGDGEPNTDLSERLEALGYK